MSIIKKLLLFKKLLKHRKLLKSIVSSYLFFAEYPEKSMWGSITQDEEEGIKYAVGLASNYEGPIVEIGALFGHTTCLLASLKKTTIRLIAVENFTWNPFYLPSDIHRQFTKRTLSYVLKYCSTEIFDGNAEDFYLNNPTLKPSMIFIDARHDYESVRYDLNWAISTGCPVITGHDYIDIYPGVIKAVNESFGDNFSLFGSMWVHIKAEDK